MSAGTMLAPAAIYIVGAALALVVRHDRGRAAHLAALVGSGVGTVVAARALLGGSTEQAHLWAVTPFANLNVRLDPLNAFFLLVISFVAMPVSLYAAGYLADEPGPTAMLGVAYNLFLAAMGLVVIADSVFMFLIAWEAMSLASYLLVMHNHHEREVQRAGFVYLVMTHLGTAFLTAAFLVLFIAAGSGSLDFAAFRAAAAHLSGPNRTVIFLLALVGFGTKAGVIPLHIWLPRAHPAAPSYVSALMSGVMIKTAIYGLVRVGWEFAGPGPAWWGGARPRARHRLRRPRRAVRAAGARHEAVAGLLQRREHRHHPDRRRHGLHADGARPPRRGGARARRGLLPPAQPRHLQEPALPRRGRDPPRDAHAEHGETGRPDPPDAVDGGNLSRRRGGDRGDPALQRVCQRVADAAIAPATRRHRERHPPGGDRRHRGRRAGADGRAGGLHLHQSIRRRLPRRAAQ